MTSERERGGGDDSSQHIVGTHWRRDITARSTHGPFRSDDAVKGRPCQPMGGGEGRGR